MLLESSGSDLRNRVGDNVTVWYGVYKVQRANYHLHVPRLSNLPLADLLVELDLNIAPLPLFLELVVPVSLRIRKQRREHLARVVIDTEGKLLSARDPLRTGGTISRTSFGDRGASGGRCRHDARNGARFSKRPLRSATRS